MAEYEFSVFYRICAEYMILSLYAIILVNENRYSRIFYPAFAATKKARTEKDLTPSEKTHIP